MRELLLAVMMVASRLSGLPVAAEPPTMMFLPQEQLCVALEVCDLDLAIAAHYDMETRVLTLPTGWSPANPRDMGTLVHEMVHHLQASMWPLEADRPCAGDIERLAYETQHEFLALLGLAPEVGPLLLLVLTTCED